MSGFAARPALRLRWRGLLAVLAFAGSGVVVGASDLWWSEDRFATLEGEGRRSQAYLLEGGELEFEVPTRALEIRLLTTALVERAELSRQDEWRYGVDLDFPEGRRQQFFRSRATLFQTPTGTRRYALTLLGSAASQSLVPLDSRTARFQRPPASEPFTLRIEAQRIEPQNAESDPTLAVRVYFRERVPEHRRSTVWPRLSERERRQRAVGNVYPPELLTATEREELMSFRWSALAPKGVEGDDFERLVLFQHAEPGQPVAPSTATLTSGLRLPAGLRYRLPPFRGALVARPLGDAQAGLLEGEGLTFEQGPGDLETYAVNAATALDLVAAADVALTAQPEEGEVDLRAEALRLYGCASPLDYALAHGAEATPLRIDLRTVEAVPGEATVELLDESGATLSKQRIEFEASESLDDWLDEPTGPLRVSEAFRRYVPTSTSAARLRFSDCTEALRLVVYNRPGDRPAQRSAPPHDDPIKDWWVLLPGNKEDRTSSLLRLQPRVETATASQGPPGRTLRSLRPNDEDGRYVLLPREQSAAPGYFELARGEQQLDIAGSEGRGSVQPRLLYRRSERFPFRMTLTIDGRVVLDEELAGRQGEVILPPLASGSRRVDLNVSQGVQVFLGNVAATPGRVLFARRLTFRAPESFSVDWDHNGTRTAISGRLFTPGNVAQCRVQARLVGARSRLGTPSASHTFPRRRWSLEGSTEIAALGSDKLTLRRSAPFFFLLGEDLEPGPLTVRYDVSCPNEVFLTLSVLDDAPQETIRVWRESAP